MFVVMFLVEVILYIVEKGKLKGYSHSLFDSTSEPQKPKCKSILVMELDR